MTSLDHPAAASSRPASTSADDTAPRPAARPDHPLAVLALAAVIVAAVAATAVGRPDGVVVSSDPGYAPRSVLLLIVPSLAAIALALCLPPRTGPTPIETRRPGRVRVEALGLLAIAVAFPLLVPLLPWPEDYVLLKVALFLVVPCTALWLAARRGGPSLRAPRGAGPLALALIPVMVLVGLKTVGPFSTGLPDRWPPLPMLLVAAIATAISAGVGEEVLYRRLLQTRLEALAGPWTGILATSIIFGLMHLLSHGDGSLWMRAAQVIALQGTTGIALGVIWARWRSLGMNVLAHVLINGLAVLLHLLSLVA